MIFAHGAISMTLSPRFHLSFDSDEEALGHKTVGKVGASTAAGKKINCGQLLGLDPKDDENWTLKVAVTKEHLCDLFVLTTQRFLPYSLHRYHIFQILDANDREDWMLKVAGTKVDLHEDGFVSCESTPRLYLCCVS